MVKMPVAEGFPEQIAPSTRKPCILLVDDDEIFAATAARNLLAAGYHVETAGSFQVALGVLERPQPLDLLVTDLVMPHQINGIALSRMARMRRRDLKVIFVTGYDIPAAADDQAMGPILRKPVSDERLLAEVERVLGES
jgi:CheY-like chemotaxis protein